MERQKAFEQHLQASAPPQQPPPRPQRGLERGELGWSPDPAQSSGRAESLGRPGKQGSEGGSWWSDLVGWLPWRQGDQPQTQSGEPHSKQHHDRMHAEAACPSVPLAAFSSVWCSQALLPSCAAIQTCRLQHSQASSVPRHCCLVVLQEAVLSLLL